MVDYLLSQGHDVVGYDNFSTGQKQFLSAASLSKQFTLVDGDLLDTNNLKRSIKGVDIVYHFAANADVRFGLESTFRDLEQNTIATYNVLESMRVSGVTKIVFSSTGSVYGEASVIPTPEDCPFPTQTSLYGASKLACEGLISAYAEGFGITSYIFRFVSILGERYSHGHVIDFYRQLLTDPSKLRILGDGKQRKSYLYVGDCIQAISSALQTFQHGCHVFNLGVDDYCTVKDSIRIICSYLSIDPVLEFTGGDRGWVGDNPFIYLATEKIRSTGWLPQLSIEASVIKTIQYLESNHWLLQARN